MAILIVTADHLLVERPVTALCVWDRGYMHQKACVHVKERKNKREEWGERGGRERGVTSYHWTSYP